MKGYISIQQRPPTECIRLYPSNSVHPPSVQGYIHPTASTHRVYKAISIQQRPHTNSQSTGLYPPNSAWFQHDSNIACPVSDKLHVQALTASILQQTNLLHKKCRVKPRGESENVPNRKVLFSAFNLQAVLFYCCVLTSS